MKRLVVFAIVLGAISPLCSAQQSEPSLKVSDNHRYLVLPDGRPFFYWFNPRQNSSQLIGTFRKRNHQMFTPLTTGRNNDWVLVIDDASKKLPRIGDSYQNIVPKVKE